MKTTLCLLVIFTSLAMSYPMNQDVDKALARGEQELAAERKRIHSSIKEVENNPPLGALRAQPTQKPPKLEDIIDYFETQASDSTFEGHVHKINLTRQEVKRLKKSDCSDTKEKNFVRTDTKQDYFHFHEVVLCKRVSDNKFLMKKCDNADDCWDSHPKELDIVFKPDYTGTTNFV